VRFHDFHLAGYTVSDFGGTIVLDLVYDYPDQPRETSRIKFSDVASYHFIHTCGAIILDIAQVPIPDLIQEVGDQLAEWCRLHGSNNLWSDDRTKYIETLENLGYHGWTIDSAIGFEGFVIAKTAEEIEDETHPKT
jgi:hypothetical protein